LKISREQIIKNLKMILFVGMIAASQTAFAQERSASGDPTDRSAAWPSGKQGCSDLSKAVASKNWKDPGEFKNGVGGAGSDIQPENTDYMLNCLRDGSNDDIRTVCNTFEKTGHQIPPQMKSKCQQ
jgi:hypothetical protein